MLLTLFLSLVLSAVDAELENKQEYDASKSRQIAAIWENSALSEADRFLLLVEQYSSYNYDTALLYTRHLEDEAVRLHDDHLCCEALVWRAFVYLSGGLFKESLDLYTHLLTLPLDSDQLVRVRINMARLYYDLSIYADGDLAWRYEQMGIEQSKEVLALLTPQDTSTYWSQAALLSMKTHDYAEAVERYRIAMSASDISVHERTIALCALANCQRCMGDSAGALQSWAEAAISDLRQSTKEIVAMQYLAEECFRMGEIDRAYRYIRSAQDDAIFYSARLRQLHIGRVLSIIDEAQFQREKKGKMYQRVALWVILLLTIVLAITSITIYRRNKALHRARQLLEVVNARLVESNRIKEGYIGNLLCEQSKLFTQMNRYQNFVVKRVKEKKTEELLTIPSYISATIKRREAEKSFDELFLHIFPDFVERFNAMLVDDWKLTPKRGELLNTELRIFALIRLGITDNEQIAQVLDYSVNTIYTYKTRVLHHCRYTNEEFYRRLMGEKEG